MPTEDLLFLLLQSIAASILVYYGVVKLFMPKGTFDEAISAYKLFPQPIPRYLAQVLPYLEILLGVLLLFQIALFTILISSLFLLLCFQTVVGSALIRKLHIGCGCSGQQKNTRITLIQAFLRNWLLIAMLIAALLLHSHISLQAFSPTLSLITPLVILSATILVAIASALFSQRTAVTKTAVQTRADKQISKNRRTVLAASIKVALSLLSLPVLNQFTSGTAFACIPTDSGYCIPQDCDCTCIQYMVTTAPDCQTYCGNCQTSPCFAPIYMRTAYYCCGKAKVPCDMKLTFERNYQCF